MFNNSSEDLSRYSSYREDYRSKCSEWKSQPVTQRRCTDAGCLVWFFILTGVFIGAGIYYISSTDVNASFSGLRDTNSSFKTYWPQMLGCIVISLVVSFTYIFLVKTFTKFMVYLIIILTLALLLAMAIIGIVIELIGLTIAAGIMILLYCCVLFCFRRRIQAGIILIKVASKFISEKPAVFLTPFLTLIPTVIITAFWFYSVFMIFITLSQKNDKNESNTVEIVFLVIWFLTYFFYTFLLCYFMTYIIAVFCSFWYYGINDRSALLTAFKWIGSSFGSLVFAATLISVVAMARSAAKSGSRQSKNCCLSVFLCLLAVCLSAIEDLLQILNNNSVIVMSVTGESYIDAAKTTIGIICEFFPLLYISNLITSFLVFWGLILCIGIPVVVAYFTVGKESDGAAVFLVIAFSSMAIGSIVFSVLTEAVGCVFIFYAFDCKFKEFGYGATNMPDEINQLLGNNKHLFYEQQQQGYQRM